MSDAECLMDNNILYYVYDKWLNDEWLTQIWCIWPEDDVNDTND